MFGVCALSALSAANLIKVMKVNLRHRPPENGKGLADAAVAVAVAQSCSFPFPVGDRWW